MSDLTKLRDIFPVGILAVVLCFSAGIAVTGLVWAESETDLDAARVVPVAEDVMPHEVVSLDERAEIIAMSCAACHGTEGRKASAIPALAGKPQPVLSSLLLAFKQDQMPDATVMPRLTKGYTDEELTAVAEYFSSLSTE